MLEWVWGKKRKSEEKEESSIKLRTCTAAILLRTSTSTPLAFLIKQKPLKVIYCPPYTVGWLTVIPRDPRKRVLFCMQNEKRL